jgi:hypothetical protein
MASEMHSVPPPMSRGQRIVDFVVVRPWLVGSVALVAAGTAIMLASYGRGGPAFWAGGADLVLGIAGGVTAEWTEFGYRWVTPVLAGIVGFTVWVVLNACVLHSSPAAFYLPLGAVLAAASVFAARKAAAL